MIPDFFMHIQLNESFHYLLNFTADSVCVCVCMCVHVFLCVCVFVQEGRRGWGYNWAMITHDKTMNLNGD